MVSSVHQSTQLERKTIATIRGRQRVHRPQSSPDNCPMGGGPRQVGFQRVVHNPKLLPKPHQECGVVSIFGHELDGVVGREALLEQRDVLNRSTQQRHFC